MENEGGSFLMGRSAEITRDEIKFQKFIDRLRLKFSALFLKTLEKQLLLKGIVTPDDWILISQKLKFDYARDNYYAELKEAEIINNRVATLQGVQPYIGRFYSNKWVQQNVLRMTDEEMEEERAQIIAEQGDPIFNPPMPEGLDMGQQPEEQPEDEEQDQAAAQQQTQKPATQDKPFTQPKTG
jgi:hypothetical protein